MMMATTSSSSSSTSLLLRLALRSCYYLSSHHHPSSSSSTRRIAAAPMSTSTKDKKKSKGGKGGGEDGGDASKNQWYIKMLDEPPGLQAKALPEDVQAKYQAIGKRYNIEYNRRAAKQAGDLHRKIKLKMEAIAALPEALQKEAKKIDDSPFPATRRLTTHTPPVPGFEAGRYDLPGAI